METCDKSIMSQTDEKRGTERKTTQCLMNAWFLVQQLRLHVGKHVVNYIEQCTFKTLSNMTH